MRHWGSSLLAVFSLLALSSSLGAQVTTVVDTTWFKSNARRDFAVLDTPGPDDPSWVYSSQVWTGGPIGNGGCPIPDWQPGYWAPFNHLGGCFDPATHQWFRTVLELDRVDNLESVELIALFRPGGRIGINDNLYLWINPSDHSAAEVTAYGGTSEIVPQVPFPPELTDRLAPSPVHGVGAPCGGPEGVPETQFAIETANLPVTLFRPGANFIDVLLEDFCIFGGMSHLAFRIRTSTVVAIDIKPGSSPNAVNPRSQGKIPVALLTTSRADGDPEDFDAWEADPATVTFGPDGAEIVHSQGHAEDVDGDGDLDRVFHFKIRKTGIACGDRSASLSGRVVGGQMFAGSDSVKTVRCRG